LLFSGFKQVCGVDAGHIDFESLEQPIHRSLCSAIRELKAAASQQGFELRIASGFRDFDRQLMIWNGKARGERTVLDKQGNALAVDQLSPEQLLEAILHWSALPGGSRHHWGCDVDIYDAAAVEPDYRLQLTVDEARQGPFSRLHQWLDGYLSQTDFYRPYSRSGAIAEEPWHLSYRPLAEYAVEKMQPERLKRLLAERDIELKTVLLDRFDAIYQRYIQSYF